jgi:hypothetical protein
MLLTSPLGKANKMRVESRDYLGKGCNLDLLADAIEEHFQVEGYQTQALKRLGGSMIQARKSGIPRDLLAADRAFTATVTGDANNFRVSFGIGKWTQNLGVAPVGGVALAPLVFFVEVPISLWSYEIERVLGFCGEAGGPESLNEAVGKL